MSLSRRILSYIFRIYLCVFSLVACLFPSGCGKKTAPDPNLIRSRLTLGLYDSLDKEDHHSTINQVKRLQALDPGNSYLPILLNLEKDNLIIIEAQKKLSNGDLEGAAKIINDAIADEGRREALLNAQKQIVILKELKHLVNSILSPENAFQLAKDAIKLRNIVEKYPPAQKLSPFIDAKLDLAIRLNQYEKERALFHLGLELDQMVEDKNLDGLIVWAQLETESPVNPMLPDFKQYIQSSIEEFSISPPALDEKESKTPEPTSSKEKETKREKERESSFWGIMN